MAEAAPDAWHGKRVLLVEDEALIALDAEDALQAAGFQVIGPAHQFSRAKKLAESAEFDAAVLDISLAGVLVWPVAEILDARKIPFVLLTGFGRGLDPPPSCGRAPLLAKPLRPDDLVAALTKVLAGSLF